MMIIYTGFLKLFMLPTLLKKSKTTPIHVTKSANQEE